MMFRCLRNTHDSPTTDERSGGPSAYGAWRATSQSSSSRSPASPTSTGTAGSETDQRPVVPSQSMLGSSTRRTWTIRSSSPLTAISWTAATGSPRPGSKERRMWPRFASSRHPSPTGSRSRPSSVAWREAVRVAVLVVDQSEHEPRTWEAEDQGFPVLALFVDDLREWEDLAIPGGTTGEIEHRQRDVMDCLHLVTLTFLSRGTRARPLMSSLLAAGRSRLTSPSSPSGSRKNDAESGVARPPRRPREGRRRRWRQERGSTTRSVSEAHRH